MASVASQLIEEVTAHVQSDSLDDAREICVDGTYFPNNLRVYIYNKKIVIDGSTIYSLFPMLLYHFHKHKEANRRIIYTNALIFPKNVPEYSIQFLIAKLY